MLERYFSLEAFIPWTQIERPLDPVSCFGREAPLELEIGFGTGEYLVRRALEHPDHNFLGLELFWKSVRLALRRITHHDLANVRVAQVDARIALERLLRPKSVHRIQALFPYPWTKEKHARHRLFRSRFLQLMNSRLEEDGKILIITDMKSYADWIEEQVPETGLDFERRLIPPSFDTRFERKWTRGGQEEFYELCFRKRKHVDSALKEDVVLQTHRLDHIDPDRLELADTFQPYTVVFKEKLYDPQRRKALVRAYVSEGPLQQNVWISLTKVDSGWTICIARGSLVIPTASVQQALNLVRDAALKSRPKTVDPRP